MLRSFRPMFCRAACGATLMLASVSALAEEVSRPVTGGKAVVKVAVDRATVEPNLIPTDAHSDSEVVQERYESRQLKIERHVARDANGDYKNHGAWAMWDERGQPFGFGNYHFGERHGKWVRFFIANEADMLRNDLAKQFTAPFKSEATFDAGQIEGEWVISDANRRVLMRLNYDNGLRNGTSTHYYPNGRKWKEVEYRDGELDGTCYEWDADGQLLNSVSYIAGRRIDKQIEAYSDGSVKFEAQFLFAKEVIKTSEDWWAGISSRAPVGKIGNDLRHGPWTTWYKNGQKAMEGLYREDLPSGKFTWYHPNGQKAIEGAYVDGKQSGRWQWYYESGARHIQGEYVDGQQRNRWNWWTEDGELAEAANYDEIEGLARTSAEVDAGELETVEAEPKLERLPTASTAESPKVLQRPQTQTPIASGEEFEEEAESEVHVPNTDKLIEVVKTPTPPVRSLKPRR